MKSIDEKIALSEAQWRRYRYENMGVRESADGLLKAVKRSASKRIRRIVRTVSCSMRKAVFIPSYDEDKENIVVSLTSTAGRIRNIFPTLYSLTVQTRKPDLIVLWLSKDKDYRMTVISRIEAMGVVIKYREDLGPNTKYYYAFDEYKNDVVITVDDDIIYDREMTEELYGMYLMHPESVTARRVHKIRFDCDRQPVKYLDWIWEYKDSDEPADDLFATGVGGVLYPPAVIGLKFRENKDFLKICPVCDDVWLKFCELSCGIKVCAVKDSGFYLDVINQRTQKNSLAPKNVVGGRNDEAIKACAQYFGFADDLCERVLGK